MSANIEDSERFAAAGPHLEHTLQDYAAGRFEAALLSCDEALASVPSLAEAHNLRGVVLEQLGRPEEAAVAYGAAIDLDPTFHEAEQNLRELAEESAARMSQAPPAPEDKSGDRRQGRLPARDPDVEMARLYLQKAYQAYESERFDAALASAYFAQALDPESAEAYNVRGLVLEELGQPGAAAEAYQKASRLDPSLAVAGENLQELEAELAEARQLVVVASFLHPLEAHIATAILEASGIRTFLAD